MTSAELLHETSPDDLMPYGLIPELVGRLPVVVSVEPLDQAAMIAILTEPKNALVKQFKRLFELDGVELVFTDDALEATAEEAMSRKTGARGLRTIIEETLLDVMYEIPSRSRRGQVRGERRDDPPQGPAPAADQGGPAGAVGRPGAARNRLIEPPRYSAAAAFMPPLQQGGWQSQLLECLPLRDQQLADPLIRQVEHGVERPPAERLAFRRALHLHQPTVAGHDHVEIGCCRRIFRVA